MLTEFPQQITQFLLPSPAGSLEVMTTWPKQTPSITGVICHPHPLFAGTMNNKVVTTIAKAFDQLGLATVRFNFRGVGKSTGEYGETIGEREDLTAVLQWVKTVLPQPQIWLAGFSFGSYIAAAVANKIPVAQLVTVAPAVHHNDFAGLTNVGCPWLIIQGEQDEIVPFDQVKRFVENPPVPVKFIAVPGAGHFFHGRLIELRDILVRELSLR